MAYLRLFSRLFLRPLTSEPLRTGLTVFAVALGVAVVLAIDLAGDAAAGSFRSSVETLAGDADFEVTSAGGVPDEVVTRLVTLPYPLRIQPRIEDFAVVVESGQTVPLIGVDIVADTLHSEVGARLGLPSGSARRAKDSLNGLQDAVWVSPDLAHDPGEEIRLQLNDHVAEYEVAGILKSQTGSTAGGSVVVMDIALAMRELGKAGRLDRILIQLPKRTESSFAEWETILHRALPPGVGLERQGTRANENRRMLEAFRWNLRILSYIALVVGAFFIYNTMAVSVVRRRAEIGILRALGASGAAVLAGFLGESTFLGLMGSVAGIFLGRLMAEGAVRLIASTVDSLYVTSRPAPITLSVWSAVLALAVGVGVALVSALSPAREASETPPVEAMARGRREYQARLSKARDLVLAALCAAGAAVASRVSPVGGKPLFGYLSALLLIVACVLAIPATVAGLSSRWSGMLRRMLGVEAFLAFRSLAASLWRASVLIAALCTAVAMMVSVGIMVGSFRETVVIWMDNQLQADLYLRPAGLAAADRFPTLAPEIASELEALPGVAAVDRFRAYSIIYDGLPATLGSGESRVISRLSRIQFLPGPNRAAILKELKEGDSVVVSEPFASKHHVRVGDTITLPLRGRSREFHLAGIYYDYASERGTIVMDRATMLKYLPDPAPSSLAVYLAFGAGLQEVRQAVERACAGRRVLVFSNRALRAEAIRIFDRTFAITYALEAIAVVVGVMGVAGALLSLVIDRRRELGLLKFLGASKNQVRNLILFEAGLLGLLANLAGSVLGVLLSLILIFVINKQSFGWTIQFHWPVAVMLGALSVVYAATVAAGFYPARVGMRLNPIEVIHEE